MQPVEQSAGTAPDETRDEPTGGAAPPEEEPRWRQLLLPLCGVVIGAGAVLAVPHLRHALVLAFHGNLHGLHHEFHTLGLGGEGLLLCLMISHAIIYYPTELVSATTGIAYGFPHGLALSMLGWVLSSLLSYAIGMKIGKPVISLIFGRARFAQLERAVERGGVPLLIVLRLIPVLPFSLTGYVAGAVRTPLWRFVWTTFVGYLPLTAIVVYLGSQSESLSATNPKLWAGVVVILILLYIAHRAHIIPTGGEDERREDEDAR